MFLLTVSSSYTFSTDDIMEDRCHIVNNFKLLNIYSDLDAIVEDDIITNHLIMLKHYVQIINDALFEKYSFVELLKTSYDSDSDDSVEDFDLEESERHENMKKNMDIRESFASKINKTNFLYYEKLFDKMYAHNTTNSAFFMRTHKHPVIKIRYSMIQFSKGLDLKELERQEVKIDDLLKYIDTLKILLKIFNEDILKIIFFSFLL